AAAYPALWITGESEWLIGWPRTAARLVIASRNPRCAAPAQSTPFFRAMAMLASCCARVSANAGVPFLSIATKYSQLAGVGFIAACRAALLGLSIGPMGRPGWPAAVFHGFFGSFS